MGTEAAAVRANLTTLTGRHPIPRGMQLFDEALDVDAGDRVAHRRRTREAGRTVNGAPVIARAVVLGYADGAADLVLVAHRRAVDRRALDQLATALADPAHPVVLPEQAAGTSPQHDSSPDLPWGLGDPAGAGRTGTVVLTATAVAGDTAPAVPVAATAVVLARYCGTERAGFALITGGPRDTSLECTTVTPSTTGKSAAEEITIRAPESVTGTWSWCRTSSPGARRTSTISWCGTGSPS